MWTAQKRDVLTPTAELELNLNGSSPYHTTSGFRFWVLTTSSFYQDEWSRLLLTMIGLGRIPSGQTEDKERPKSFRGVVGDCEGGLPVGVLVLRRRAQSIKDFFLLVCFCSDSERKQHDLQ